MWPLTVEGGQFCQLYGRWTARETANEPSRTRKPTLDQSMVLTGGGGKAAMAKNCVSRCSVVVVVRW